MSGQNKPGVRFGPNQKINIPTINARLAARAMNNLAGKMGNLSLGKNTTRNSNNNMRNLTAKMAGLKIGPAGGRRHRTARKTRRRHSRKN